jgi:hypothetical protein
MSLIDFHLRYILSWGARIGPGLHFGDRDRADLSFSVCEQVEELVSQHFVVFGIAQRGIMQCIRLRAAESFFSVKIYPFSTAP